MKRCYQKANPAHLLETAKFLLIAKAQVHRAIAMASHHVKTPYLDKYAKLATLLGLESVCLEDNFAELCAGLFHVPIDTVPLFGSLENIERAEEWWRDQLRRARESGRARE